MFCYGVIASFLVKRRALFSDTGVSSGNKENKKNQEIVMDSSQTMVVLSALSRFEALLGNTSFNNAEVLR